MRQLTTNVAFSVFFTKAVADCYRYSQMKASHTFIYSMLSNSRALPLAIFSRS